MQSEGLLGHFTHPETDLGGGGGATVIAILQIKKLRSREVRPMSEVTELLRGCTARCPSLDDFLLGTPPLLPVLPPSPKGGRLRKAKGQCHSLWEDGGPLGELASCS